ncbi:MAG: phosphate acyltransferase PlsX [Candidatus Brocadiia bacterium]
MAIPESANQKRSFDDGKLHIVVDGVGGDRAPSEPVAGAVTAARRFDKTLITLVGPRELLEEEVTKHGGQPSNLQIEGAPEVIGMHESPVRALREKRDSSINRGATLVASGTADAFVSAGNTGAVVAASTLGMGLIEGVQKPGIAIPITALDHSVLIIDVGANVHCKPTHLFQYALMADVFARDILKQPERRVGLLNVGEEERKGTTLLKEAHELLADAPINFVGNIEAREIFFGGCDIVVCEGFVGNVLLKTSESLTMKLVQYLKEEISKKFLRRIGFALCKDVFKAVRNSADYAEYGGAPLLGIDGVTIIGHGRSDAKAIENAVREARSFVSHKVNSSIIEALRSAQSMSENSDQEHAAKFS